MDRPVGESDDGALRVDFDRRLRLEFHGGRITSDAGLLAYRELDDALGLTDLAGDALSECRSSRNTRHVLAGLLRQSVFGRLAGYEDVNDAERLSVDPAMRAIVDRRGLAGTAASLPEANAEDRKLYDHVVTQIYPRQVEAYPGDLAGEVRHLQVRSRTAGRLAEPLWPAFYRNCVYKPMLRFFNEPSVDVSTTGETSS